MENEDNIIHEAIKDARRVQEYIWQELSLTNDLDFDARTWQYVFQKRVDKIAQIRKTDPLYKAELRKRVLQQAALSICALKIIDKL